MTKQFLAQRNGDILTSENGFVYAWARGSVTGNQICTLAWLQANRRKFTKAGWMFQCSTRYENTSENPRPH